MAQKTELGEYPYRMDYSWCEQTGEQVYNKCQGTTLMTAGYGAINLLGASDIIAGNGFDEHHYLGWGAVAWSVGTVAFSCFFRGKLWNDTKTDSLTLEAKIREIKEKRWCIDTTMCLGMLTTVSTTAMLVYSYLTWEPS